MPVNRMKHRRHTSSARCAGRGAPSRAVRISPGSSWRRRTTCSQWAHARACSVPSMSLTLPVPADAPHVPNCTSPSVAASRWTRTPDAAGLRGCAGAARLPGVPSVRGAVQKARMGGEAYGLARLVSHPGASAAPAAVVRETSRAARPGCRGWTVQARPDCSPIRARSGRAAAGRRRFASSADGLSHS